MIDFHSHILPGMDDGSRDTAESVALLRLLAEQGVSRVVATPHYHANDEPISRFLERRAAARDRLMAAAPEGAPAVSVGAEVRYYQGISRHPDLSSLCIEDTDLLLLEMPVNHWTEHTAREIAGLAGRGDLTVVLAHIERYRSLQNRRVWELVSRSGVMLQVNADYFLSPLTRGQALRRLADGEVHLIGSDCHGTTHRPPRMDAALRQIRRRLGDGFVQELIRFHHSLFPLGEAEPSHSV